MWEHTQDERGNFSATHDRLITPSAVKSARLGYVCKRTDGLQGRVHTDCPTTIALDRKQGELIIAPQSIPITNVFERTTTVTVSPREATTVAKPDFSTRTQNPGKPTILIVEDHDDTRELLRTLYEMWGCRVVEACDGLEAVDAASKEHPALILMDGSLPFLDGLGATRRIRENRLLDDVRIVAVTGWGGASYTTAALDAGCNDCLLKPFDLQRLKDYLVPFRVLQPNQKDHQNPDDARTEEFEDMVAAGVTDPRQPNSQRCKMRRQSRDSCSQTKS